MKRLLGILLALSLPLLAADPLRIYWIDVEGGAATLIVTPAGETVLMDTGYTAHEGRDPKRVMRALKDAGASKIDYFLASHFHSDHVGGITELSTLVPIAHFIDHGDAVDQDGPNGNPHFNAYVKAAGNKRHIAKPGEKIALRGVELLIVAAHSKHIAKPLPGGAKNSYCDAFQVHDEDKGENGKSMGYRLRFGNFDFVNLGDLSWNFQGDLACPVNLLGKVDLFQATHHGVRDDVLPQQMWAMAPTVTVMNNGPTKGAGPEAVETVKQSPGLADFWQLHRAVNNDAAHNAKPELTANLGETAGCEGHWIKAEVKADGSYTITNGRTGFSKTYASK